MSGIASKVLDPANMAGMRPGGVSISGILDPIGQTVMETTGYQLPGRESIAKFVNVPGDPPPPSTSTPVTDAQRRTAAAKKDKLKRYSKLRAGSGTIMTTELEDFK